MPLIKLIGLFITAMGIIVCVNPKVMRKMMNFWKQGKRIYLAGVIRICFGVLFLYCAPMAMRPNVIFILGILAILGGLFIIIRGPERMKLILENLSKKPDNSLRWLSLIILIFGALIIFSA
ncbi:MAG: hypothetical protein PHT31_06920 [Candidatus Omnitrophica bacterium]|nr:hypothetical protein [Candidatus Omnitrophota bacterium]MDD5653870.1 hypothetical protein [Candidatus Omnitrophota bacterium]